VVFILIRVKIAAMKLQQCAGGDFSLIIWPLSSLSLFYFFLKTRALIGRELKETRVSITL
jgi:hypothetical protein